MRILGSFALVFYLPRLRSNCRRRVRCRCDQLAAVAFDSPLSWARPRWAPPSPPTLVLCSQRPDLLRTVGMGLILPSPARLITPPCRLALRLLLAFPVLLPLVSPLLLLVSPLLRLAAPPPHSLVPLLVVLFPLPCVPFPRYLLVVSSPLHRHVAPHHRLSFRPGGSEASVRGRGRWIAKTNHDRFRGSYFVTHQEPTSLNGGEGLVASSTGAV